MYFKLAKPTRSSSVSDCTTLLAAIFAGKMGATSRAGVFLLLVELMLPPGHGARQVTDKVHVSSKKCPQATKNGKYT